MTGAPTVLVERRDGIARVVLNRPERRNAVSWRLIEELLEAIRAVRTDPEARVLVLTGAGRDFCVGADLARVGSDDLADQESRTLRGRSVADDMDRLTQASAIVEDLVTFPKPTIAAVNGACAGAGLSLALATDLQVVASHAVLNTAFIGAGVPGDFGSAWLLTRAVGSARARALLLDPEKMTATEAATCGLVTEAAVALDERVAELAAKLANQSLRAMGHAKQNLLDAVSHSLSDYLRHEVPRMVDSAQTDDSRRAARTFMSRREVSSGRGTSTR